MTLQHLLLVLRARWRWVALSILLCLLVVAGVNMALPKQYRASATVVVDVKGNDPVAGSGAQPQPVVPGYLATQVGIVASTRVIQKVIASLHLDTDPLLQARWQETAEDADSYDTWLTARLIKKLDVRPAREGSLIDIAVNWDDAARAAEIANGFAQAYINTNLELKVEPAKLYAAWFDERNHALREELEAAQQRLSSYQRATGIVAAKDARLDVENMKLSELSSQLTALQGTRAESASRQRQADGAQEILPEVMENKVVIGLKIDLSRLEARRVETAKRVGPNHPDLQRLDDQIAALRENIAGEIGRVASSLGAADRINRQREAVIRAGLDAQRRHVLELSRQRDEIAVLQNDVASAQRAYDTVTQRLAQMNLESQNQTANVMIVTPAVAPVAPDSPRTKVNLALAGVFGLLLGVALALVAERLDPRVHGAEHLRHVLAVPVFGLLGQAAKPRSVPGGPRLAIADMRRNA